MSVPDALFALYGSHGDPSPELLERQAMMEYRAQSFLAGFPIIGTMMQSRDNWNYMYDYMTNRGLSWSDIEYPTRTVAGVDRSAYGALNFVSSNIERLYR